VHQLKVGVSGIRGVVGEFLTPSLACAFAQAFGAYVGAGRVVVGRDSRSSGPMLQHAVTCGLLASGCEVIDVGVMPTPTIQIYIASIHARGGISLTASHNPPEYNGYKVYFEDGGQVVEPYASGIIAKVNAVESDVYTPLPAAQQGKVISMGTEIDEAYMKRLETLPLDPELN
jgi:phosphomannomutase